MHKSFEERIFDKLRHVEYQLEELAIMVSMLVGAATKSSRREFKIMNSIAELQAKADETLNQVRAETTVLDSVKVFVQGQNEQLASMQKQIEELISSGGTSSEDLQKLSDTIDAIRSANESNTAALAAAIVKDTPAEGGDDGTTGGDGSTGGDTGGDVGGDTGGDTSPGDGSTDETNNTTGGGSPVSTDSENPGMGRRRR